MYQTEAIDRALAKLTPQEKVRALQQIGTELFKSSLYLTAKYLLGYHEVNWRTHGDMIHALEGEESRKLIIMPRGTFKTSIAVIAYPIWRILKDPNLRIMIDSELFSNAKRSLREISQHLNNERLTSRFGPFRGDSVWNESEILINQRTQIKKEATFMASGIGAEKTGVHADLIIADDLCSPSNMGSPDNREKVWMHYCYYTSILEPGGTIVVVGTRYSTDDIYQRIMTREVFIPDAPLYDDENGRDGLLGSV